MYIEKASVEDSYILSELHKRNFFNCWDIKYFSKVLDNDKYFCFKSVVDTATIGFILGFMLCLDVEILTLCVSEQYRGHGLGKMLLESAIDYSKKFSNESVFLEVDVANVRASSLYKKLGFSAVGYRKEYYTTQSGRSDAIVYRLIL